MLKVYKGTVSKPLKNPVVSIGVFDGVHRGHTAVVETIIRRSEEMDGEPVIVTFWPHPRIVLGKTPEKLKFLTTLHEKRMRLESLGIRHLLIIPFSPDLSLLPACEFVKKYLAEGMGLKHLVFGHDHHFGRGREGSFENMKDCARKLDFTIEQVEPLFYKGERISSSSVRMALLSGNIRLANSLLGYPYTMEGKIVGGLKIGRKIGFPTANMHIDDPHKLVPSTGVYAVEVEAGEKLLRGMMNIGYRPTLTKNKDNKILEVHIIDFNGNIYNRNLQVRFIERVRDEKEFSGLKELKDQLEKDKQKIKELFSKYRP